MKMEIELTDDQAKKVDILKENGMEIGEAIDLLFEMRDTINKHTDQFIDNRINQVTQEKKELEEKMNELDDELSLFNKLKDKSLDVVEKSKLVENQYAETNPTYDETVHEAKRNFKWAKIINKF